MPAASLPQTLSRICPLITTNAPSPPSLPNSSLRESALGHGIVAVNSIASTSVPNILPATLVLLQVFPLEYRFSCDLTSSLDCRLPYGWREFAGGVQRCSF